MSTSTQSTTRTLDVPGATITYDVHRAGVEGTAPPLMIVGSPMAASGFTQLVDLFDDRTVVTYDPRGTERSTLAPGGEVSVPVHADDVHRVALDTGLGPFDVLGSSGGAVVGLSWIEQHPQDLRTLVAHEPPITTLLEDAELATAVQTDILQTYRRDGFGAAMAQFIQLVSHVGPLPADYRDRPAPDPAMFGMPTTDDGSRDALLFVNMETMPSWAPDGDALRASGVRIVPAVSSSGDGTMAWRGGAAVATLLGLDPVVFPGDHGGFAANEWSPDNDPAAFAAALREVLAVG